MNKSSLCLLVWVLVLLAGTGMAAAGTEPLSIEDIRMVMPLEMDAGMIQAQASDTGNARRTIAEYEQSITELESAYGVYGQALGEELLGLGLALYYQGEYRQAAEVFQRSLQISRVNDGLHHLGQLPALELLIKANTALDDWEALTTNYHYMDWVYRRAYGDEDPQQLEVIYRIGLWHLEAYQLRGKGNPMDNLLRAAGLFDRGIGIIDRGSDQDANILINFLYARVLSCYELARYLSSQIQYDPRTDPTARDSSYADDMNLQRALASSYKDGKDALERVIRLYEEDPRLPAADRAMAVVYLADWYLLFSRRMHAVETYQEAYRLMQELAIDQGENGVLTTGEPQSIPSFRLPGRNREIDESQFDYVVAAFDLTPSGQARNIRIIDASPPDNKEIQDRAASTIRTTLYRPVFENGQPIAVQNVSKKYLFHH